MYCAALQVDSTGFTEEFWEDLAEKTEGFSGRGISKLMLGVQATVYGRQTPTLTLSILEDVVRWKLDEFHDTKSGFSNLTHAVADKS
jgi:ATPase family AAA domain-containing protein 3A/B